jgi:plastocyanin
MSLGLKENANLSTRSFHTILAQSSVPITKASSIPQKRSPFAIWVTAAALVFSGLDLLYGISPDLPKLSSSSDPLLFIMILFIALCFVGTAGVVMQKLWGYIIAALVSFGFIIGANGVNSWIPTLMNPHDFNTFIVADTIVPALVLVAVFTTLCMKNRKKGLNQKRYLFNGRSFSGALTIAVIILTLTGAVIGASLRNTSSATSTAVSVSIINGAFDPSSSQHFVPATLTVVIGVNNTVSWANDDSIIHTVTGNNGGFNSGLLNTGNSWSYTFTTPGTYQYHCAIHPFMTGTVVVVS